MNCTTISTDIPKLLYFYFNANSIFVIVSNFTAFYMLKWYSPKEMKQYKLILMNLTFWSFLVDFLLCIFIRPVNMFPLNGGFGSSIFDDYFPADTVFWIFWSVILATTGTTNFTTFGFYYRLCAITLNHWIFKHQYYVPMIAVAQFLLAMPINTVFFTLMCPSRKEMEEYINSTCPSVSSVFKYNEVLLVDSKNQNFQRLMFTFNFLMVLNIVITAYSVTGVFRYINSNELRARMSEKTRQLNKQFTKSLIFQTAFPFPCYCGPIFVALVAVQMGTADVQDVMHFAVAVFNQHSSFSSIIMLFSIAAFRKKIIALFVENIPANRILISQSAVATR